MIVQQTLSRRSDRRGFTLMEVLVVVAILVVLAGTASIFVFKYLDDSKKQRSQADLRTITSACVAFKLKHDEYPSALNQLLQPPDGGAPYLESADAILDPWGKQYSYDPSGPNNGGLKPDIWTTTPDNIQIGNWMSTHARP